MRSDKTLNEASKRITRMEVKEPLEYADVTLSEPLEYADVTLSFSAMPSCDAARKFVGKEFVIGSNTFRIFAVEDLNENIRIDGAAWELKVRCSFKNTLASYLQ